MEIGAGHIEVHRSGGLKDANEKRRAGQTLPRHLRALRLRGVTATPSPVTGLRVMQDPPARVVSSG